MRFHTVRYFEDRRREWRWSLTAPNGRIVATSGEGYKRLRDAEKGYASGVKAIRKKRIKMVVENE